MTTWLNDKEETVNIGDTVTNFRGDTGTFQGTGRPSNNPLFPPKVIVNGREYNASVWGLITND